MSDSKSARHVYLLPRDIGRTVRRKVYHGTTDYLGLAPTLWREHLLRFIDPCLRERALCGELQEHALDHTNQHTVGADVVPPLLPRDALQQ